MRRDYAHAQRLPRLVRVLSRILGKENVVMARPGRKPYRHCRPHSDPGTRVYPNPAETPSRRQLPSPRPATRTLMDVWFRGPRCWIGSNVWPVRGVVTSNVITARSSADLKRLPLVVVLDLPLVTADYAEQISHGGLAQQAYEWR
jgi:hypothetical protein